MRMQYNGLNQEEKHRRTYSAQLIDWRTRALTRRIKRKGKFNPDSEDIAEATKVYLMNGGKITKLEPAWQGRNNRLGKFREFERIQAIFDEE